VFPTGRSADDQIAIALSKGKLILLTFGAFLFVVGGIWLFDIADTQSRYPPIFVKGISVLEIGFFGLCGVYALLKLFDGSPGLVLDSEGMIDNSSAVAAGRIAWRDICDVQVMSVSGQRILAFVVHDPEKYFGKGNMFSRLLMKLNYRMYGTPIFISAHALKIGFENLEKQIQDFRRRYGDA
jgi:hypothetical protein